MGVDRKEVKNSLVREFWKHTFDQKIQWTIATEKLNTYQSKKVMRVWKYPLEYMTKQKNTFKIIYKNGKSSKNGYFPRNSLWAAFWGTL